ncbi:FcoT-like thioesterase domain protein [Streptomyces sp. ADI96-02]|uniref:(2E)-enoyl-ACP glycyltransferase n=1 Tax=unclassified Streptomyces TaxID=2593676 RepID=UPI000F552FC9|nr:FcoT family thioesterase [Streptomyces sp. ADI96-02]RPK67726.1 FcoT-like thioesterase domain protein [Streptomyces sp. ADI96-02]
MTAPDDSSGTPRPARLFATDQELLARVLAPYKAHCRYLLAAEAHGLDGGLSRVRGTFAIPESCYIDDTGHLNSVEVNLAYNQMMYYLVAKSVKERLLTGFESWTLDDFWRHQLPDILIARFAARFRRPVNPRSFSGELEFRSVDLRSPGGSPLLMAATAYRYWDAEGGRCDGDATLAFVNTA